MKKLLFVTTIFLIVFLIHMPLSHAGDCGYGSLDVWYSKDRQKWVKATVHNETIQLGESFYVKATVKPAFNLLSVSIRLWETGESSSEDSSYQLLQGEEAFYRYYDILDVQKNEEKTYILKFRVKPNSSWYNAYAPLNIYAQFDKNVDDNRYISFTVVNLYIQNETWSQTSTSYGQNKDRVRETSMVEWMALIMLLIAVAFIRKKYFY
ncbi:MAG: sarcinarray family MAST domain-containing protein [Candidatus Thermoplasmatota archaeon]